MPPPRMPSPPRPRAWRTAERNALNVVLKRLMPLSAYAQLPDLSQQDVEELIEGVSIRSEQNSNTRYLASLDVSFNSQAVKQLLDSQNIAYSEARAEAISILPLVLDGASVKSEGAEGWQQAWEVCRSRQQRDAGDDPPAPARSRRRDGQIGARRRCSGLRPDAGSLQLRVRW